MLIGIGLFVILYMRYLAVHKFVCPRTLICLRILLIFLLILIRRTAVIKHIFLFAWTLISLIQLACLPKISDRLTAFWWHHRTFTMNSRVLNFWCDTSFLYFLFLFIERFLFGIIEILFEFSQWFIVINCVSFTQNSVLRNVSLCLNFIFLFIDSQSTVVHRFLDFFILCFLTWFYGRFSIFSAG